jgi:hypothetical protein
MAVAQPVKKKAGVHHQIQLERFGTLELASGPQEDVLDSVSPWLSRGFF